MSPSSLALTARDFDAYLPEKAASNAFTRPRLEVKQRALSWARNVTARLAEQGFGVEVHATDEHPSHRNKRRVDAQWVFFWRDEAARNELAALLERNRPIAEVIDDPSPYTRHAFLGLRVDATAVEVCFAVHPEAKVDNDNLRARLAEGSEHLAEELAKALHALPDQFEVRAGDPGDGMRLPSGAASPVELAAVLARSASDNVPLWIGWRVPREIALEHAAILDEQLEDAVLALFPVYRLIAWSRDNDHIGIEHEIEGLQREHARTHAEVVALEEKWKADKAAAREQAAQAARARAEEAGAGRRPVTLATLFKSATPREAAPREGAPRDPSAKEAARAPAREAVPAREAAPARVGPRDTAPARNGEPVRDAAARDQAPARDGAAKGQPPRVAAPRGRPAGHDAGAAHKPTFATKPSVDAHPKRDPSAELTWEKGAKVGILSGPFAGKVGTIAEMEGTRSARVLLGLLSTRLELAHLTLLTEGAAAKLAAGPIEGAAARKAP